MDIIEAVPEQKKRYINILFDERTLEAIDDWQHRNKLPSRNEAIRWLTEYALKEKPKVPPKSN